MPEKADKPTQNSALQGISEQENFMIKVLFICHGITKASEAAGGHKFVVAGGYGGGRRRYYRFTTLEKSACHA